VVLRSVFCWALAAAVVAVAAPSAGAITPATGISPPDGAAFDDGDNNPHFVLDGATDSEFVTLEISTSSLPGQDGTLADDFVVLETSLDKSDAFPGHWTGQAFLDPGHYFWQAYGKGPRRSRPTSRSVRSASSTCSPTPSWGGSTPGTTSWS